MREFIYAITDGHSFKIGWSRNPELRMHDLQTGNPRALRIYGTCEGGRKEEKELHETLSAYRGNGEWFKDCPAVRQALLHLRAAHLMNQLHQQALKIFEGHPWWLPCLDICNFFVCSVCVLKDGEDNKAVSLLIEPPRNFRPLGDITFGKGCPQCCPEQAKPEWQSFRDRADKVKGLVVV